MDSSSFQLAINGLVLLLIVIGLRVWGEVLFRRWLGVPVIGFEPRRPVPWTFIDIGLILLGYFFLQLATMTVVFGLMGISSTRPTDEHADSRKAAQSKEQAETKDDDAKLSDKPEQIDPRRYTAFLLSNVLANVLAAVSTLAFLRSPVEPRSASTLRGRLLEGLPLRLPASWSDLGLARPALSDLKLGLLAFVAALIPISALQMVLNQFTEERHPIVKMLQQQMNPGLLAVSALAAIVVAPFVEELLFRVVFQGWLERIQMLKAASASEPAEIAVEDVNAVELPTSSTERLMPWPIVLSSLLFALAHLGNGYDPIPLFFLALVLGYLYQRTHRIWPSLVVHFALNSCSLFVLFMQPIAKGPAA